MNQLTAFQTRGIKATGERPRSTPVRGKTWGVKLRVISGRVARTDRKKLLKKFLTLSAKSV